MPSPVAVDQSQLLDRSDQLGRLHEHLDAVRADQRGRLVLVSGEAGVGKTALLTAFVAEAEACRVLWGACDSLFTPRPLGPLLDIGGAAGGELATLVEQGALPHDVAAALLRELARRRPTILVLEDVHWADGATLDVLRLVGRRAVSVPALMLVSYRDTELGRLHPLRQVIGQLGSTTTSDRMRLTPLSHAAVTRLAAPYGADPDKLYHTTGGNPFFVTEALAAQEERIPATLRDAVLARAERLSPDALALLEAVAVSPPQAELWLLELLPGTDLSALDDGLASGMLTSRNGTIVFRHELSRLAIEEAIAPDRKLALHRAVLAALMRSPSGAADLARLAHHAERAGDGGAVLRFAPAAGDRASSLGAHREAAAQYARALRFGEGLPLEERARLLVRRSYECYLTAQDDEALAAAEEALACYRELGDPLREGNALRWRALTLVNVGRGPEAVETARDAVRLLEQLPPGLELAGAYGALAGVCLLFEDGDEVAAAAAHAIELAESIGDTEARIAALTSLGTMRALEGDPAGRDILEGVLPVAQAECSPHQVGRVYMMLGMAGSRERSLELMGRVEEAGSAFCDQHDVLSSGRFLQSMRSWIQLERGEWEQAADTVALVIANDCTLSCVQARIVLGLLRARRGDPDPWGPLERAATVAERSGQLWWLSQLAAARAEAAWLEGSVESIAPAVDAAYHLALERGSRWPIAELAWWRRRAGIVEDVPERAGGPFLLQLRGDWERAAAAWHEAGCPYEAALALAEADDESALREALDELNRLGARPAAAIVARRLRERGARKLPRGPRAATRANPAGLTPRELEVLRLVAAGLRNGEIAERLFLSEKTVHHHVSAILRKLDVSTRGQAAAEAQRLGLSAQAR